MPPPPPLPTHPPTHRCAPTRTGSARQAMITSLYRHFADFDEMGGAAAARVRPLLRSLVDHVEGYCRSPRPTHRLPSTVETAARAAGRGRRAETESGAHRVYDDLARVAAALHRLSATHLGRDPARAVDVVSRVCARVCDDGEGVGKHAHPKFRGFGLAE